MLTWKMAVNYAKALFAISGTTEQIQKRQEGLDHLAAMMHEYPQLLTMLSCSEFSIKDRLHIIEHKLKVDLDPMLKRFLEELFRRRKIHYLGAIATEYYKIAANYLKNLDVHVESFESLSEPLRKRLLLKLESKFQKKINLIESVNPELLSGFILLMGNKQLDLSIKGKLTKLKQLILKGET